MEFISIKQAKSQGQGEVSLRGWVHRERGSKKLKFVVLRDAEEVIQLVIEKEIVGEEAFSVADKLRIEASIQIQGTIKADERAPGGYEVSVKSFSVVGECADFPLGKDQSSEFLLDLVDKGVH